MSTVSKEQVITYIENLSVLELSKLVKELEEKFGVSSAPVAMAVAGGAVGGEVGQEALVAVVAAEARITACVAVDPRAAGGALDRTIETAPGFVLATAATRPAGEPGTAIGVGHAGYGPQGQAYLVPARRSDDRACCHQRSRHSDAPDP